MKRVVIMAAVVMFAMVFSACSGSAEPSAREADKDVAEETEETTEDPEEAMAAYKAECQEFDYRDYFRYEQEHLGEKLKLELQVDQVIDGDFRGYDVEGNEYYIYDEREEEAPFQVMEGDILTVYGEYSGVVELTRAIGEYEAEVFSIKAKYADLMGEETEEGAGVVDYSGLENYVGTWQDSYSQRCNLEITQLNESQVSAEIHWSSSATEDSQWTMTGTYQPDGTVEYSDGCLSNLVYGNDGSVSSQNVYTNGTGRFFIENGILYWEDDVDNQGAQCTFEKAGFGTGQTTAVSGAVAGNLYSDSILLWKSYDTPLVNEDFTGLSKEQLRIARNEIYAAHGRIFTSQDLIDYFNSKPWYQGTIPADQFNDSVLTQVQKDNIEMIQLYEDLAGQEEYSERYSGVDLASGEHGIPQASGDYTYVNTADDSQYVTLTIGMDVSLLFYGATGYSQEMTGFSNMNDQEYYNSSSDVALIFNDYGREMVYIMSDGSQIVYRYSH